MRKTSCQLVFIDHCRQLYVLFSTDSCIVLQAAVSMLKQEYKENETSLKEAIQLGVKVFGKTLDTNKLTSEKGKF